MQNPTQRRAAPNNAAGFHPDALVRARQIIGEDGTPPLISVGRTHFYALVKEGRLPQPRKVGAMSLWRVGDLLDAFSKL
ncbi:helix-turn-helix transcriptional regulator [Thiomonas sp.]